MTGASLGALLLAARLAGQQAGEGERPPPGPSAPAAPPARDDATVDEDARAAPHPRLGSYELAGEMALGLRTLDVHESEAQFEEDQSLESGLFLRDFELSGKELRDGSGPASFELGARGLGTRSESARGATSIAGVDVLARLSRTRFAGAASTDLHAFDFERESADLSLAHDTPAGAVRHARLALGSLRRDGFVLGSRSVNNGFVPLVPVDQDERSLGAGGELGLALGALRLDLAAGVEALDTRDRRSFQAAHPTFPQRQVSEDFAADTEGLAQHARLRFGWTSGRMDWDAQAAWRSVSADGVLVQHETGVLNDPDLPFRGDTAGDSDFDGRELSAEVGFAWPIAEDVELQLGLAHEDERDTGVLERTVTLDELMGDPPSVSTLLDDLRHASRLERLELGLEASIGEALDVELTLEGGLETIEVEDVSDGIVIRRFDDTVDRYGADARADVAIAERQSLEVAGGFGVVPTESSRVGVDFTYDDTRAAFGSLGWRWRSGAGATLACTAKHERRTSLAFGSEGRLESLALSGSAALARGLEVDGALVLRAFDSRADKTFLVSTPGPTQIDGSVSFRGTQGTTHFALAWDAAEDFRPRLASDWSAGRGDARFDYVALELRAPWRVLTALEAGLDLAWIRFAGDGELAARDYDAWVLTLYLGVTF